MSILYSLFNATWCSFFFFLLGSSCSREQLQLFRYFVEFKHCILAIYWKAFLNKKGYRRLIPIIKLLDATSFQLTWQILVISFFFSIDSRKQKMNKPQYRSEFRTHSRRLNLCLIRRLWINLNKNCLISGVSMIEDEFSIVPKNKISRQRNY